MEQTIFYILATVAVFGTVLAITADFMNPRNLAKAQGSGAAAQN